MPDFDNNYESQDEYFGRTKSTSPNKGAKTPKDLILEQVKSTKKAFGLSTMEMLDILNQVRAEIYSGE